MNASSDDYYLKQQEPWQSCLLALKYIIMKVNVHITHEMAYQIPFFSYKGYRLAFLWITRKRLQLGFITDKKALPLVDGKKQKDQYEMMEIDPNADLPIDLIADKIRQRIQFYEALKK